MATDQTRLAYEALARGYDDFTGANDYEQWIGLLLGRLELLGLDWTEGDWVLDVACGTGRAFGPLASRGWRILGSDISSEMIDRAREKVDGRPISLDVADMCDLPEYRAGGFKLVLALNDPINYLIDEDDLLRALNSIRRNLAEDGLMAFDVNTIALFRANFEPAEEPMPDGRWTWEGRGEADGVWEALLAGDDVEAHVHRMRHYSVHEVQEALLMSGLEPLAAIGHRENDGEIILNDTWSEEDDIKIIHVARRCR